MSLVMESYVEGCLRTLEFYGLGASGAFDIYRVRALGGLLWVSPVRALGCDFGVYGKGA